MTADAAVGFWLGQHAAPKPAVVVPVGRYMNYEQCAVYLGRTRRAVEALVHEHKIPHSKQGTRTFFDREKIDAWMDRHSKRGAMV